MTLNERFLSGFETQLDKFLTDNSIQTLKVQSPMGTGKTKKMNITEFLNNGDQEKGFSFEVLPPLKGNSCSLFQPHRV